MLILNSLLTTSLEGGGLLGFTGKLEPAAASSFSKCLHT